MADVEDRHRHLVAQALEVGQDLGLARLVERGERFVGEDQARRGKKRAADGDAAASRRPTARRAGGRAGGRSREGRRRARTPRARPLRREPRAVAEVLAHGEMRETAAPPGRCSRSGAGGAAGKVPRRCRSGPRRPSAIRPSSGRRSPATALTIVVLPEPDRPNSTVMPCGASNAASSAKPPKAWRRRTSSVMRPRSGARPPGPPIPTGEAPPWPPRSPRGRGARRPPARPGPAGRCRSPRAASGSGRGCSTRR
jgi:hypothetical protein